MAKLTESIDALPEVTKCYKFKGIKRSQYQKRHYGHWCPYMPTPQLTAEHRRDGTIADNFVNQAQPLFYEMSAVLGGLLPRLFKDMQLFPVPGTVGRMCGAWASCVINDGGDNPKHTNLHRDVKESPYGYSCVIACGDYIEGDLILYDLGCKIQLNPGDILIFPDSLIHHMNEEAEGKRKSVVAFTQQNMFDYWNRRHGRKQRTRKKQERRQNKERSRIKKLIS